MHRKNAWWWQIYLTLRLKLCEYGFTLSWACGEGQRGPGPEHLFAIRTREFIGQLTSLLPPEANADLFLTTRLAESAHRLVEDLKRGLVTSKTGDLLALQFESISPSQNEMLHARNELKTRLVALWEHRKGDADLDREVHDYVADVLAEMAKGICLHHT